MDTFGGATTSGTPLKDCATATDSYIQAFDAMHWAINRLKAFCNELAVVYIPGNHDRLSSFHLAHALSKSIDSDKISWDIEYLERKVHVWNDNFNAFEHGDKPSNTPLIYMQVSLQKSGVLLETVLYTQDTFIKKEKVEYITTSENSGFIHKTLPQLM